MLAKWLAMGVNSLPHLHKFGGCSWNIHHDYKFGSIIHSSSITLIQRAVIDVLVVDCIIIMKDVANQLEALKLETTPVFDVILQSCFVF